MKQNVSRPADSDDDEQTPEGAREIARVLEHQRQVRELRRGRRAYLARLHHERATRGPDPQIDHAIAVTKRLLAVMRRAAMRRMFVRPVAARLPPRRAARAPRRRATSRPAAKTTGDPEPDGERRRAAIGGVP